MESAEETKKRILQAAWGRFCHYGFGKTTMAEIAGDCEMSAANIYRFFTGKKTILAELARNLFQEKEFRLSTLVRENRSSSLAKLHDFMIMEIELTHERMANQPKINESIDFIQHERPELIQEHRKNIIDLLEMIVIAGQQSSEFSSGNTAVTAETIFAATALFHSPFFLALKTKTELLNLCDQVIALLGTGLLHRN